jgi:glycosyltransferase involved in cell wall biosynthesis
MAKINSNLLTALILTYNEEENIGRVLSKLGWIERVIVLDSYSTDATVDIVRSYSNTDLCFREFDSHARQWNFGLSLVQSRWVLTLDADYVLTPEFISEVKELIHHSEKTAYFTKFRFVVFGKPLRKNNTTARPVFFQKEHCTYYDDGHTQRLHIKGDTGKFKSPILHDDRKPLSRWLRNLDSYSVKECYKILGPENGDPKSIVMRIRKTKIFAPFFVFFYCLVVNGAWLDGWRGWHYTLQRTLVELLFALRLIEEENLKGQAPDDEDVLLRTNHYTACSEKHDTTQGEIRV